MEEPELDFPPWVLRAQLALVAFGIAVVVGHLLARRQGAEPLGPHPVGRFPDTTRPFYVAAVAYLFVFLGELALLSAVRLDVLTVVVLHTLINTAFAAALLTWARSGERRPTVGLVRLVGTGAAAGIATYGVVGAVTIVMKWLYEWAGATPPVQNVVKLSVDASGPSALVMGVATVVLAPFAEEVFFRGIVYPAALKVFTVRAALLAQAAAFGALHVWQQPMAFWPLAVPLATVGLCAGYLYHRTASLAACIALHATFNGIQLAAIQFAERVS